MKPIEDALSGAWIRPVVLSGIILTAGVHPLVQPSFSSVLAAYDLPAAAVLAFEVILFGLVASSGGTWIYYVYEGFVLSWLSIPARWWNVRRLTRLCKREAELQGKQERLPTDQDELDVLQEEIRDYPLVVREGVPTPTVTRPTLLANVIETYELYPTTRYGIDGVMFWYHLLARAPVGVRTEFDDQYAFSQGLVLASFSSGVVAFLYALVLGGLAVGELFPTFAVASVRMSATAAAVYFATSITLFIGFYRLSIPAHRETGRVFRALVDLSAKEVNEWLATAPTTLDEKAVARSTKVRRFLRSRLESD